MEYGLTPSAWIDFYYSTLNDISRSGIIALYKIGDTYYSDVSVKTTSMWWLEMFPDGVLVPGHIRQALYNLYIINQDAKINRIYPLFVRIDKYGFRINDGEEWSGYIPVITSNSRIVIKLCSMIYKNIRRICAAQRK